MYQKNRITAAILAFFTGIVGGHKVYLGKIGSFIGFMVLLIFAGKIGIMINLFLGIMEGLKLLNTSDSEFDKKYNRNTFPYRPGPLEARRESQMRQYDQLAQKNSEIIRKSNPLVNSKANQFKSSGIKKYKDFDLEDAIIDFKKGVEINPSDTALHFNLACAYSLTEKKYEAYHHISRAISLGLKDMERILSHDDLAYIRIQPEFEKFKSSGFRVNPFSPTRDQRNVETDELKIREIEILNRTDNPSTDS